MNVQPNRIYYRFIVDGVEQHDPDRESELYENKLYNYVDVVAAQDDTKTLMEMTNEELEMLAAGFDSGKGSVKSGRGSKYSVNSERKTLKELEILNAKKEESAKILQRVIKGWLTRKKYIKKAKTPVKTLENSAIPQNENQKKSLQMNSPKPQPKIENINSEQSQENAEKLQKPTPILLKLPNELSDSFKDTPKICSEQPNSNEEIKSDNKNTEEINQKKIESPKKDKLPMIVKPPAEISVTLNETECQTLLTKDDIDKWQKYFS